jgi:hypothetical protein
VESDVVLLRIGNATVPVVLSAATLAVDLPEGATVFVIEAQDGVGNRANVSVTIVADRTPPALVVDNAAGPNVTVESYLLVRGTTEPGATVMVGGYPVVATNGSFQALVFLSEGRNDIEVRARDDLGNENVTRFTITRGVLAPSLLFDTVALFLGFALVLASMGLGYFVFSRPPARRPEEAPPSPQGEIGSGGEQP